ncbi:MAG: transporter [Phycisphaerales bacterium]
MDTRTLHAVLLPVTVCSLLGAAGAAGQGPPTSGDNPADALPDRPSDKHGYTLLDPTPRALMRGLSTDRPDATESPFSVDAGHVQIEMSFLEYVREGDGPRTDTLAFAPLNLKLGLLNNTDLQLVFTPWTDEDTRGGARVTGVGDTVVRLKMNLWGNDPADDSPGRTAFAFMPFMSFPTGDDALSSGRIEGGLIFPFAAELPGGFGLGLMAEVDFVYDSDAAAYQTDFVHTAVVGRDLTEALGVFVEYFGAENLSTSDGYRASLNAGVTYAIGVDIQLDAGVRFGLTRAAEDFTVFAGMSCRY